MKLLAAAFGLYILYRCLRPRKTKPLSREERRNPPEFISLSTEPCGPRDLVQHAVRSGTLKPPQRVN